MRTTDRLRLLALAAVVGAGGSGAGRTPAHPAGGTVTAGGRPAVGVVVTLIPAVDRNPPLTSYPRGEVGADGRYALTTYSPGDGAPAGEYKVTLRWPAALAGKEKALAAAQGEGGEADRLKGRFTDPKSSPWAATVRPGDNTLDPIAIPDR